MASARRWGLAMKVEPRGRDGLGARVGGEDEGEELDGRGAGAIWRGVERGAYVYVCMCVCESECE